MATAIVWRRRKEEWVTTGATRGTLRRMGVDNLAGGAVDWGGRKTTKEERMQPDAISAAEGGGIDSSVIRRVIACCCIAFGAAVELTAMVKAAVWVFSY